MLCNLQDCHTTAWDVVTKYMKKNLHVFSGKVDTADSTIMPAVSNWITESLGDIAEVRDSTDHCIIGWLCLPTAGVIPAQKWDFYVTLICNLVTQNRKNGIVLIVHSNRAAQVMRSPNDKNDRTPPVCIVLDSVIQPTSSKYPYQICPYQV